MYRATPTISWWSADVGSPSPFNVRGFGSLDGASARQNPHSGGRKFRFESRRVSGRPASEWADLPSRVVNVLAPYLPELPKKLLGFPKSGFIMIAVTRMKRRSYFQHVPVFRGGKKDEIRNPMVVWCVAPTDANRRHTLYEASAWEISASSSADESGALTGGASPTSISSLNTGRRSKPVQAA